MLIDDLLERSWTEQIPVRGGVRRQCTNGRLTVEERDGEHWIWIPEKNDRVVLSWKPAKGKGAAALAAIEEKLTGETYVALMPKLEKVGPVSFILIDQFERMFDNYLPLPGDAMGHFFRAVARHASGPKPDPEYHASLPDSEPPSARTGLRLALAHLKSAPKVTYAIANPPFPDQRMPKAKLDVALFAHDGKAWKPAVAPPDRATADGVAVIARTGFLVSEWSAAARELAKTTTVTNLLAVTAHGTEPPKGVDVFDWVQRVQVAACLTLARLDRRALIGVALGPVDWSVTAAVIALAHLAGNDKKARDDIDAVFTYLKQQVGRPGFTCYAPALAIVWLALGGHSKSMEAELKQLGREAWQGGPQKRATKAMRDALSRQRERVMKVDYASAEALKLMREPLPSKNSR